MKNTTEKPVAVIILPTFNEAGNIAKMLDEIALEIKKIPAWEIKVLVVDDHSPDKTAEIVRSYQTKHSFLYLIEGEKEGLGKAYVRGFRYAMRELNATVVFEMDSDLSHPVSLLPRMLERIERGSDFVIGSRFIKGGAIPKDWGLHRKLFSVVGSYIAQFGFMHFKVKDWTSGYRALRTKFVNEVLEEMEKHSGYVFQIALLDKAIKRNLKITEIPLRFRDRKKGISKINSVEYILNSLMYIFNNSGFIKYVIVGLFGFAVDFGFAYLFINSLGFNKPLSNILSAEIAIIFNFFLNNFWSFRHKRIQGGVGSYLKKFALFNGVSSISLLIQGGGMYLALLLLGDRLIRLPFLNIQSWIVYKVFIIAGIVIPYSYIMYNKLIWKK